MWRRFTLLVLLAIGCARPRTPPSPDPFTGFLSSWHRQRRGPQRVISEHPERVRLTLADGSVLVLERPMVWRDSVIGSLAGARAGVAFTDIVRTETRDLDSWKILSFVAAYVTVYAALCRGGGGPDCGE